VWSSTHPAAVEPGLVNVSGTELKLTVGEGRRSQEPSRDPPEALSFKEAGAFLLAPRGRGRFSPPTDQRGKVPPPWRRWRGRKIIRELEADGRAAAGSLSAPVGGRWGVFHRTGLNAYP
jgi:hypothetical protein